MNDNLLNAAINEFVKKQNTAYVAECLKERNERKNYYQQFTKDKLMKMDEDEFYEYISKLWSMIMWGNKKYVVDQLIVNNGFNNIKTQLAKLLYGSEPIDVRWDFFLKEVKGMGPSTISELLTYINPNEYAILNKTITKSFNYLGVSDMPKYNYQYTGKKYIEICDTAKHISKALAKSGVKDFDLLAVDYFIWDELLPKAEKNVQTETKEENNNVKITNKESKSIHDEIKEKIVAIGTLLGFESQAEIKIADGAVVDAVWEAKIGNMGKAIYVFEVQSKGSIDSLILNLRKAQSNAAVQAVVAVSDESQIIKIKKECKGVIDKESLRTWESDDVLAVYDSLTRAHESINKLALVPESFK